MNTSMDLLAVIVSTILKNQFSRMDLMKASTIAVDNTLKGTTPQNNKMGA